MILQHRSSKMIAYPIRAFFRRTNFKIYQNPTFPVPISIRGCGMTRKRLPIYVVLPVLIFSFAYVGCGGDGGGGSGTSGSGDLIESLKALNIDKYMGITYTERFPNPDDPAWDVYYYDRTDCKCVYENEFYLAAREKPDNSNVIFMMAGAAPVGPEWTNAKANRKT